MRQESSSLRQGLPGGGSPGWVQCRDEQGLEWRPWGQGREWVGVESEWPTLG